MFHYNSFAGIGYLMVHVSFFYFKAAAAGTEWEWKFHHQKEDRDTDWASVFVKLPILGLIDFLLRDLLCNLIWGTKDVGRYEDLI